MKNTDKIILAKSIVFSALLITGVALYAIVSIFNMYWFYPFVAFGLAVYFAWQEFFVNPTFNDQNNNTVSTDMEMEVKPITSSPKRRIKVRKRTTDENTKNA